MSESGVYPILVAGKNISVYCDMETEGGGWTMLTLANSAGLTTWHGVLMAQHSASNGWGKCTDDDAAMFFEGVGEDSVEAAAVGYDDNTFELRYARPDTGEVYTTEQMDALRTQSTQLSTMAVRDSAVDAAVGKCVERVQPPTDMSTLRSG